MVKNINNVLSCLDLWTMYYAILISHDTTLTSFKNMEHLRLNFNKLRDHSKPNQIPSIVDRSIFCWTYSQQERHLFSKRQRIKGLINLKLGECGSRKFLSKIHFFRRFIPKTAERKLLSTKFNRGKKEMTKPIYRVRIHKQHLNTAKTIYAQRYYFFI